MSDERRATRAERALIRVYGRLLGLYPPSFRRRFRAEMREAFREALRRRVDLHGARGVLIHAWRTALDLVVHVPAEWLATLASARPVSGEATGSLLAAARDELVAGMRGLRRSPGLVLTIVPTLALGIGTVSAFFSIVNAQLFRPLPYAEPDRLVRVQELGSGLAMDRVSPEALNALRFSTRTLSAVGTYRSERANLRAGGLTAPLGVVRVDDQTLDVLGVRPLMGRLPGPGDAFTGRESVVLLGHGVWHDRFGADPSVVGRSITMGGEDVTVIGVMPEGFAFPEFGEAWAPYRERPGAGSGDVSGIRAIARLSDDTPLEAARAEIEGLGTGLAEAGVIRTGSRLRIASGLFQRDAGLPALPWLILGTGGVVLLIVCSNVAALLLARSARRRSETALRASLGATTGRLVASSLMEGTMLALLGGALGLVLSDALLQAFLTRLGANLPGWFDPGLDIRVVLFAMAASGGAILLFGLPPALEGRRVGLARSLSAGAPTSTASAGVGRVRGWLVSAQVALAFLLVTASSLMATSMLRMRSLDLGVDEDRAYRVTLSFSGPPADSPGARTAFLERALERLEALPAVEAAGFVGGLHHLGPTETPWASVREHGIRTGRGAVFALDDIRVLVVSPDFFEAVGLDVLRGRATDGSLTEGDALAAYVSASLARRLWGGEAIGGTVQLAGPGGPRLDVVGVVSDELALVGGSPRSGGFHLEPLLTLYLSTGQAAADPEWLAVRPRPGQDGELAAAVRGTLREIDRDQAVESVETLGARTDQLRRAFGTIAALLAGLASAGAGLAVLGLWGLVSRTVAERTREIGIRSALGGSGARIVREIMARGLRLTLVGLAAGGALVLLTTRLLALFLFEVDPLEPATVLTATLVFLAVALTATWLPARRATRVDPVRALTAS